MNVSRKKQILGIVILFITAIIWGASFVAQSVGMEKIEAFTFSGIRQLMGGFALLIFIIIRDSIKGKKLSAEQKLAQKEENKTILKFGIPLGIVFFLATNFQQFAFNTSTSGKIAFITALYMFFVPIIGLFFKKRVPWVTWICVIIAFVGLYFLCVESGKSLLSLTQGDYLAFACAIFFAAQILMIEKMAPQVDGIKLSCTQFFFSGIVSTILMFIFENPNWQNITAVTGALLYSGLMSCGLAYTLQIVGQKYTEATIASLIMCMESVFAAISDVLILHTKMSLREIMGCTIMFIAIIISQLSQKKYNEKKAGTE